MAKSTNSMKSKIKAARKLVNDIVDTDANEAETRKRLERIFTDILGYDAFNELSREKAIRGHGLTEHVDFAIKIDNDFKFFVELKRVNLPLSDKFVKQAAHYAIDSGLNWVVLTNLVHWQIHHIEFAQPPKTTLLSEFNFLEDDLDKLEKDLSVLTRRSMKKGQLDVLWSITQSLSTENLLQAILAQDTIRLIRRNIRKETDALVSIEDIVSALKKMLNEKALKQINDLRITYEPAKPRKPRARKTPTAKKEAVEAETKEPTVSSESTNVIEDNL